MMLVYTESFLIYLRLRRVNPRPAKAEANNHAAAGTGTAVWAKTVVDAKLGVVPGY